MNQAIIAALGSGGLGAAATIVAALIQLRARRGALPEQDRDAPRPPTS